MEMSKQNTILIVDDMDINLKMLSDVLQEEYTVYTALNGDDAIKIAKELSPDLILLDIVMPVMNGFQVFSSLRDMNETAGTPIMFITALSSPDDEQRGLQLGAVDYICKPFDNAVVKLRVRQQIRIVNQLRAIENLSMIDQLTRIPNRRNFDHRLNVEWGRAIREKTSISILILDIDDFGNYNNTYGHQQGDRALCMVAKELMQALKRTSDFAARWGGEEFIALVPNSDISGGLKIGERIRVNIESADVALEDGDITKLTVSIGVNSQIPTSSCSVEEFISKADKALYKAKNMGKNRVYQFQHQDDA